MSLKNNIIKLPPINKGAKVINKLIDDNYLVIILIERSYSFDKYHYFSETFDFKGIFTLGIINYNIELECDSLTDLVDSILQHISIIIKK